MHHELDDTAPHEHTSTGGVSDRSLAWATYAILAAMAAMAALAIVTPYMVR